MAHIISNPSVEETQPTITRESDTVQVLADVPVTSEIPPPRSNLFLNNEGGSKDVVAQLTERMYPLESIKWKSTESTIGTIIKQYSMPKELFAKTNIANTAYLQNYTYWNADIVFRAEITAPKTVYGAILVSYCYNYDDADDKERTARNKIGAMAQQHGSILHVAPNNKVELYIPFKCFKTYGTTSELTNIYSNLSMVTIFLSVLTPLQANVAAVVDVQIQTYVALKNLKLSGVRLRPQMGLVDTACKIAERMLDTYFPDPNRDNPTDVMPPKQIVLRNTQPLCFGSGVSELTQQLRLFSGATTPFPFDVQDEMKVRYLTERPCPIDTFSISQSDTAVHMWFVNPMLKAGASFNVKTPGMLTKYQQPTLSIVTSLCSRWRGGIKYRFVIPHNQFMTGKIIVAYLPRYSDVTSIEEMKNAYHMIFELGTADSFEFEAPFISDTLYKRVSTMNAHDTCSGVICMSMIAPLLCVNGSTSKLKGVLYVSAGSDYEIAVPTVPLYGIGYNARYEKSTYLDAIDGHGAQSYLSTWRYFDGGKRLIFRYGAVTDHVSQFDQNTHKRVYKTKEAVVFQTDATPPVDVCNVQYFACPGGIDDYNYLAPLTSYLAARNYMTDPTKVDNFVLYNDKESKYYNILDLKLELASVSDIVPQSDDGEISVKVTDAPVSRMSRLQYGEVITDLKDICRRYNLYGTVQTEIKTDVLRGFVLFNIPVQFKCTPIEMGDKALPTIRQYTREGPISLLSTGYRYARGSIRYKLVFSTPSNSGLVLGVYHNPDENTRGSSIHKNQVYNAETFVDCGVAGVIQDISMNSVIDVEVPFYMTTEAMIMGRYNHKKQASDLATAMHNGCLNVVVTNKPQIGFDLSCTVYYAFGDDTRFMVFNGFPSVVHRSDVPAIMPKKFTSISPDEIDSLNSDIRSPESHYDDPSYSPSTHDEQSGDKQLSPEERHLRRITRSGKKPSSAQPQSGEIAAPQWNLFGSVLPDKGKVEQTMDSLDKAAESVTKTSDLMTEVISNVKDMVCSAGGSSEVADKLIRTLLNLSHLIYSQKIGTIVTVIVQLLLEIKVITLNTTGALTGLLTRLYNYVMNHYFPHEQPQGDRESDVSVSQSDASPQAGTDPIPVSALISSDDQITTMLAGLFSILAAGLGYSVCKNPKGLFNNIFVKDVQEGCKTDGLLFQFFKNNLETVKNMIGVLKYYVLQPESRALGALVEDSDSIKSWFQQSTVLLNPVFKQTLKDNELHIIELFVCKTYGDGILASIAGGRKLAPGAYQVIKMQMDKINELHAECVSERLAPYVKLEPVCIQISGGTKVGKSYITDFVAIELLKHLGVKTTNPTYTLSASNSYWNGCDKQPVFIRDDFLQLQSEEAVAKDAGMLFALKSTQPFNPPIAELENKKILYNPLIMMLTSNSLYYEGASHGCMKSEAVLRRRDILIEVKVKDQFLGEDGLFDPNMCTQEQLNNFEHNQFRFVKQVVDPSQEQVPENYHQWQDYAPFMDELKSRTSSLVLKYKRDFARKLDLFATLAPEVSPAIDISKFRDIFTDVISEGIIRQDFNDMTSEHKAKILEVMKAYKKSYSNSIGVNVPVAASQAGDMPCTSGFLDRVETTQSTTLVEEAKGKDIIEALNIRLDKYDRKDISGDHFQLSWSHGSDISDDISKITDLRDQLIGVVNGHNAVYGTPEYTVGYCQKHSSLYTDVRDADYNHAEGKYELSPLTYINVDDRFVSPEPCQGSCSLKNLQLLDIFYEARIKKAGLLLIQNDFNRIEPNVLKLYAKFAQKIGVRWNELTLAAASSGKGEVVARVNTFREAQDKLYALLSPTKELVTKYYTIVKDTVFYFIGKYWKTLLFGSGMLLSAGYFAYKAFGIGPQEFAVSASMGYAKDRLLSWRINRAVKDEVGRLMTGQDSTRFHTDSLHGASRATDLRRDLGKASIRAYRQRGVLSAAPQSGNEESLLRLINRNSMTFTVTNENGSRSICNGTGIMGNFVVTAWHFVEKLNKMYMKDRLLLVEMDIAASNKFSVRYSDIKVYYAEDSSLVILRLPKSVPSFRDIRHHFATLTDHECIAPNGAKVIDYLDSKIYVRPTNVQIHEAVTIHGTKDSREFLLEQCYRYDVGRDGMCGSPLVSTEPKPRIIGIHIAGSGSTVGYAEPISFEGFADMETMEDVFPLEDNQYETADPHSKVECNLDGVFIIENILPKEHVVRMAMTSKLEKSPMFNQIVPDSGCRPANLNPTKHYRNRDGTYHERTPLEAGISKHGDPPIPFPTIMLHKAKEHLKTKLLSVCQPVLIGKAIGPELTDDQIFSGIPGVNELKGIELSTSEGFPLQLQRPKNSKNKSWCFYFDQTEGQRKLKGFHPAFAELMDKNMALRRKGVIPSTIFVTSLKDCLVSEKKFYAEGGTRVFSVSPLEYSWQIKKYFGQFQMAYIRNRIQSETSVGINPDGPEWTNLFQYINQVKNKNDEGEEMFFTGDYKAFGDRLQSNCIVAAFDIMIDWYKEHFHIDEEGVRIRKVLCQELINSLTQGLNVQCKKFCGIHSGFALTVEVNSIVNSLYFRCGWLDAGLKLSYFDTQFRLNCYGDDCLAKVSKEYEDKFNFFTMRDFLARHKIGFTPADKDADQEKPLIPAHEVTYLKRSFVIHPTRKHFLLAPLPEESCQNMLNWFKRTISKDDVTKRFEAGRSALDNAYSRGPEYYEDLRKRIAAWFAQNNPTHGRYFHSQTWEERDEEVFRC
uniref:Genome polyprotein n=1 Tax=Plasmopara viticola lesion associated iflavirus 1 TaxID=2692090 RepID=A0A6B9Q4P4_9VIRU|nr:RdRp [Plasmopara viticola lesion associated iflavirus 1]